MIVRIICGAGFNVCYTSIRVVDGREMVSNSKYHLPC